MADLGLDPKVPLVGMVGQLVYQNAHDVFLEAASVVGQRTPQAQFLLVGEGPLRGRLEWLALERGLWACRVAGFRAAISPPCF